MPSSLLDQCPDTTSHNHDEFLQLVPIVERHARITFRHLTPVDREEATAEAIAAALVAYRGLRARGLDPLREFPSQLATSAVLHVKDGRHVGGRASSTDVLSPKAQARHGFQVEALPAATRQPHEELYGNVLGQRRIDAFEERLQDNRRTPPAEQAAFRIDFREFMGSLCRRDHRLAEFLALGHSGKDAAARFRLTPGRVSQLRHGWHREWRIRSGDLVSPTRRRHPGLAQRSRSLRGTRAAG